MGGSQSTERDAEKVPLTKSSKKSKKYITPDVRVKSRFLLPDTADVTNTFEASVDKYDILLVFNISEGRGLSTVDEIKYSAKPTWKEVKEMWKKCLGGSTRSKENSVEALKKKYELRKHTLPTDFHDATLGEWLSMARVVILDELAMKAGLQLKISQKGQHLMVRIRVPIKRLELQADIENYKLPFKGEIDPGSEEFWNQEIIISQLVTDEHGKKTSKKQMIRVAVELEEEKKMYTRQEADAVLDKLLKCGKLTPDNIGIPASDENDVMLNRRVHAWERIADRIPVWNRYPAYGFFDTSPKLRYLFAQFPSVRGKTLFCVKDRLYLSKCVLDSHYDFKQLEAFGFIKCINLLHDASRGERISNDILTKRWVMFWACSNTEVGSPLVTDIEYEPDEQIAFWWRPFSQPLIDIREYFGEVVALYAAWFGHYTYCLIFPALASFVIWLLGTYVFVEPHKAGELDYFQLGMSIFLVTWVVFYTKGWQEQEHAIKLKWGTAGFEDEQKDRPEFEGKVFDDGLEIRSLVDNKVITFFPDEERIPKKIISWIVLILFVMIVVIVNVVVFFWIKKYNYIEKFATSMNPSDPQGMTSFQYLIFGVLTPIFSSFFMVLANQLTSYENHQTNIDHEDALISKYLVFQIFNNFTALLFVAFAKKPLFNDCIDSNCIRDIRELLICIFLVRYALIIIDFVVPYLKSAALRTSDLIQESLAVSSMNGDAGETRYEDPDLKHYSDEIYLYEYEGPFHDYADSTIQYGYVVLFASVVPLIVCLALAENLVKMRLTALKMCVFRKRPFVDLVEDVGMWSKIMELMGLIGFVVNTGVIVFSSDSFNKYTMSTLILIFLIAEQSLMVYKMFLSMFFQDPPEWIDDISKRNEFIVLKYQYGFNHDDDNLVVESSSLENPMDIDRLSLQDVRNYFSKKEETRDDETEKLRQIKDLQKDRRVILKDLKQCKENLQAASLTETYNDSNQMGEDKAGNPTGKLKVKLLELSLPGAGPGYKRFYEEYYKKKDSKLKNISTESFYEEIKLCVHIKHVDRSQPSPCPPYLHENSCSSVTGVSPERGIAVFDATTSSLTFFPLAALDGVIEFNLIDCRGACGIAIGRGFLNIKEFLLSQENITQSIFIDMYPSGFSVFEDDITAPKGLNGPAKLKIEAQLAYSKVKPLREKISCLMKSLSEKERLLARLQCGVTEERGEVDDEDGD